MSEITNEESLKNNEERLVKLLTESAEILYHISEYHREHNKEATCNAALETRTTIYKIKEHIRYMLISKSRRI